MEILRQSLQDRAPYHGFNDQIPHRELNDLGETALEASAAAHTALYEKYHDGDPSVVVFDDEHAKETGQYIGFTDTNGKALFGPWNKENPATDIGLRGANPEFEGILNPTTIIHADTEALNEFKERGAPEELLEAIHAVAMLNRFIVKNIAKPYIRQVAEVFGHNPDKYERKFFPEGERSQTLTRGIMYHKDAPVGMRPVSKMDGSPLLIKEHADKSAYTIDTFQTHEGLQYLVNGEWVNASTAVACFRGAADDELTERNHSATHSVIHRVVERAEQEHEVHPVLIKHKLARAAFPTFISMTRQDARIVVPNSIETHPTV